MIIFLGLAEISPEQVKVIGIVAVMVTACAAALLYPIARAYARRLEGRAPAEALRQELAEIAARLEELQHGQARMLELEERLDFAERLLISGRQVSATEADTPPEPVDAAR